MKWEFSRKKNITLSHQVSLSHMRHASERNRMKKKRFFSHQPPWMLPSIIQFPSDLVFMSKSDGSKYDRGKSAPVHTSQNYCSMSINWCIMLYRGKKLPTIYNMNKHWAFPFCPGDEYHWSTIFFTAMYDCAYFVSCNWLNKVGTLGDWWAIKIL